MTHTRGPWHTAKRTGGIAIEHREERPYGWLQHEVALVYPLAEHEKGTGAANARLIAAAPDMLAALEFVLPCLMDINANHPQALSDDELAQIKRTIAKAKP